MDRRGGLSAVDDLKVADGGNRRVPPLGDLHALGGGRYPLLKAKNISGSRSIVVLIPCSHCLWLEGIPGHSAREAGRPSARRWQQGSSRNDKEIGLVACLRQVRRQRWDCATEVFAKVDLDLFPPMSGRNETVQSCDVPHRVCDGNAPKFVRFLPSTLLLSCRLVMRTSLIFSMVSQRFAIMSATPKPARFLPDPA